MKIYAKNPAELVIENPGRLNKKDNTMSKRKRNSKGQFMKKSKGKRKNQTISDEVTETGKDLFLKYGLAAFASIGVLKGFSMLINKVPDIPQFAKDAILIGGPFAGGIATAMLTDPRSPIAQGIAGGMVLASANTASDKFLRGKSPSGEMAGLGQIEPSDMILKPDGILYDQEGNPIAEIQSGNENGGGSDSMITGDDPLDVMKQDQHLLGEAFGSGFGETFEGSEMWSA